MGRRRQWSSATRVRNLPLRWSLVRWHVIVLERVNDIIYSMSDPGTTYRTREEIQRMRSTQDPIKGLQRYIEDWGLASEQELKVHLILLY
jgi:hypothetical protein